MIDIKAQVLLREVKVAHQRRQIQRLCPLERLVQYGATVPAEPAFRRTEPTVIGSCRQALDVQLPGKHQTIGSRHTVDVGCIDEAEGLGIQASATRDNAA